MSLFGTGSTFSFSTPAFGTTAAFSFSTPSFGTPASTPAFSSAPTVFGAAPQTAAGAGFFGSSFASPASTPPPSGFGSLFGAASTPAASFSFGSGFGAQSSSTGTATTFALAAPASAPSSNVLTLKTKWEELDANMQQHFLQFQNEVSRYRDECDKLDKDTGLHDKAGLRKNMEDETFDLKQSLAGLLNSLKADEDVLADFRSKVLSLLHSTEVAVRLFQRSKFWREAPQQYKGQMLPPALQELLSAPCVLPSRYLQQAITGFGEVLEQHRQCLAELEQAVPSSSGFEASAEGVVSETLPTIIAYMHEFFIRVAAQMEKVDTQVQARKEEFLAERRRQGKPGDPFEAGRGEPLLTLPSSSIPRPSPSGGGLQAPHAAGYAPSLPAASPPSLFGAPSSPSPFGGAIAGSPSAPLPLPNANANMGRTKSTAGTRRKGKG